jgi:hypothetical protein
LRLYFLLEGRQSEPQLYRYWLAHAFPELREVRHASELEAGCYRLKSAGGYPEILKTIRASVSEVESCGVPLDEFFLCLDAEEESYEERYREAADQLHKLSPSFRSTVIVQDCCIETWLLGDRSLLRPPPQTQERRDLQAFYDVRSNDPEGLPRAEGYATRARFHFAYLKAVLRDRNRGRKELFRYSKKKVGSFYFSEPSAFQALVRRHDDFGHLRSFGHLLTSWRGLGAEL